MQRPYLTEGEAECFYEVWSRVEGDASQIRPGTPGEVVRDAWRAVADVRDPDLVKLAVLDTHVRMAALGEAMASKAKLVLLEAYSSAFIVFLMLKLPDKRRRDLPMALQRRGSFPAHIEAAHNYWEFLLDREEAGGPVEPLWEDLMSCIEALAIAWDTVVGVGDPEL